MENIYLNHLINPEYQSGHNLICGKTGIKNIVKEEIRFLLENTEDNIIVIADGRKDIDSNLPGAIKTSRTNVTEVDDRAMPLGALYGDSECSMYKKIDYFIALTSCLTGKELQPELKSELNSFLTYSYKENGAPTVNAILSWFKKNIPEAFFSEQRQGLTGSVSQREEKLLSNDRLQYLIADNPAKQLTALEIAWVQIQNFKADRKYTRLIILSGDVMLYNDSAASYFYIVMKRLRTSGGRLTMCISGVKFKVGFGSYLNNMDSYIFLQQDLPDAELIQYIFALSDQGVRRHIVGGANRTLISAITSLRSCGIGTCRRLSSG